MFFEQQIRILEWFLKDNVTGVMMLTIQLWNHRNRPTFNYIRGFFFCHIHNYTEYNQQWNLCSAFNPSKCTHTRSSGQPMLRPGEQLGVQCLAQGSRLSRGIEGGENARYSLPPLTIPAGAEIRTHNLGLRVRRSIQLATTGIYFQIESGYIK